jgi:molybdopterin-binding protein
MASHNKLVKTLRPARPGPLIGPRDAAQILGISYPTLKQWIYKKRLRTVKTAGGHHRIPEPELDRFLYRAKEPRDAANKRTNFRRISGRNQLVGRVVEIKISGLIAQVTLSIGGQRITSIITADAVREMRLRQGDTVAALIKSTEVMIVRV